MRTRRVAVLATAALLAIAPACGDGGDGQSGTDPATPATEAAQANDNAPAPSTGTAAPVSIADVAPGSVVVGEITQVTSDLEFGGADDFIICLTPTDDPFMDIPCPTDGSFACAPPYEGDTRAPRDPCNFAPYVGPSDGGLIPEDLFPPDCSGEGGGPIILCVDD